jgi:hypothetical protein
MTNKTERGAAASAWLEGFAKSVGAAKATYYLQGTGVVRDLTDK